jgi:hypothetical protein
MIEILKYLFYDRNCDNNIKEINNTYDNIDINYDYLDN